MDSWGGNWDSETGMEVDPRRQAAQAAQAAAQAAAAAAAAQSASPGILALYAGGEIPVAPGAAHRCEVGKPYLVKGQLRISDGRSWRCEHNRWPSECPRK